MASYYYNLITTIVMSGNKVPRNLPLIFPLRYAIIVEEEFTKKKSDALDEIGRNILWEQLIEFLQHHPLTLQDLRLQYEAIGIDYNKKRACFLPKLNAPKDWATNAFEKLPDFFHGITAIQYRGTAFRLSLYSYEGGSEVPLFWKIYDGKDKGNERAYDLGLFANGGYVNIKHTAEKVWQSYTDMVNGKIAAWERLRSSENNLVSSLIIPCSSLWRSLDKGTNDGLLHTDNQKARGIKSNHQEDSASTEELGKIKVVIARGIGSLLNEEISSLYQISRFCNNCSKALPFRCSGKYCPAAENPTCYKERARKRKKKSQTKG